MSKTFRVIAIERSVRCVNAPQHRSELIDTGNGLRLRVVTWGEVGDSVPKLQVPILLVHGLASNALLWQGAAIELVRLGHPVMAVDLRGHGHSDKPEGGYDVTSVADDLAQLLEIIASRGFARPVVAGQSWGGNVVIELAHKHGGLVRGVCAVDGGFLDLQQHFTDWEACAVALRPPPIAGTPAEQMRGYMLRAHPDWPKSGIDGAMANFDHLPNGTIEPWLTLEKHLLVLRGLWEHIPTRIYRDIKVPVLFVPAEGPGGVFADTKRTAIATALSMVPDSRVEWFSPADHDLQAQYPERFAAVLHGATMDGFFS